MTAFSFRRDFKKVQWGRTLWLNLLRAFAAGVVWAIVVLVASFYNSATSAGMPWYALPFILPIAYLFFLPVYLISAKIFTAIIAAFVSDFQNLADLFISLVTIVFGLAIAVGDPLVFALHRTKPRLVPTERFNFVNVALVLYVLDPAKIGLDA